MFGRNLFITITMLLQSPKYCCQKVSHSAYIAPLIYMTAVQQSQISCYQFTTLQELHLSACHCHTLSHNTPPGHLYLCHRHTLSHNTPPGHLYLRHCHTIPLLAICTYVTVTHCHTIPLLAICTYVTATHCHTIPLLAICTYVTVTQ